MSSRGFVKLSKLMHRPESRLAAACAVLLLAVVMLVNVSLVSCDGSGPRAAAGRDDVVNGGGSVSPGATRADFGLARISGEPEVRVRIGAGLERVQVSGGAGAVVEVGTSDLAGQMFGPSLLTLRVAGEARREGGDWIVTAKANGAELLRVRAEMGLVLRPVKSGKTSAAPTVMVNGTAYPARVRLIARSEAGERSVDAVAHLSMEEYLPGVVAKEMLSGWPLAAYQVQAVCSRSYALHERMRVGGSAAKSSYDVDNNERDQAYAGATSNKLAIEAVKSTRGMVLADGDQVLRAYYSSTCGGRTGSARDTWPTGPGFEFNLAGPIQAATRDHACQKAPLYRWTIKRDRADLAARLRTYGEKTQLLVRKLRDLAAIEVAAANSDGRPSVYKIIEPGGAWYQLSAEQLRLACNQSGANISVSSAEGIVMGAAIGPVPDLDRKQRVASGDVEFDVPRVGSAVVTITGRGFGHGVGMCQYCAKGFAERGEDWRTMVARFYPGARVVGAW